MHIIQDACYAKPTLSPIPNSALRPNSYSTVISSFTLSSGASKFFCGNLRISNPNPHRGNPSRASSAIRAAGTDYYSTLKVGRNASLQEIKGAYRKLARKVCGSRWFLFGFSENERKSSINYHGLEILKWNSNLDINF